MYPASPFIGVNPGGGWGVATPTFWAEGRGEGLQGGSYGSWTGRKIILSYHVLDLCSKVATFEEK